MTLVDNLFYVIDVEVAFQHLYGARCELTSIQKND